MAKSTKIVTCKKNFGLIRVNGIEFSFPYTFSHFHFSTMPTAETVENASEWRLEDKFLEMQKSEGDIESILGDDVEAVTIESLMDPNVNATHIEYKVSLVVCLSMKHKSMSSSSFSLTSVMAGNKRQKLPSSSGIGWDRMFVFGDLLNPGNCAVVMFSSRSGNVEAKTWTKLTAEDPMVGQVFAILEPSPTQDKKKLGPLPIISSFHQLIPLQNSKGNRPITDVLKGYIPKTISAGSQRYFVIHNVSSISMPMFLLTDKYTCPGRQCDKSQILHKEQVCGCCYQHRSGCHFVGEFTVVFPNPFPENIHDSETVQVNAFRSSRTTDLFFSDLKTFCDEHQPRTHHKALRDKIKAMTNHVNTNGGWTLAGWFRKGEVIDNLGGKEEEKLTSTTVQLHLCYLLPTALDRTSNTYTELVVNTV